VAGLGTGSRGRRAFIGHRLSFYSAGPSLEGADDPAGDAVAVEAAWLRDDLLAVEGAAVDLISSGGGSVWPTPPAGQP
jgi:hypothetical protein